MISNQNAFAVFCCAFICWIEKNPISSFCNISSIPGGDGELKSTGKYLAIRIFIY